MQVTCSIVCGKVILLVCSCTRKGSQPQHEACELCAQCGKLALLDRLLTRLHRDGHKVLIFSQVRSWAAGSGVQKACATVTLTVMETVSSPLIKSLVVALCLQSQRSLRHARG